ncbi:MAG: nitroreductase family deazaflavin-dependent oxidoreductase [Thermoplasmata archaeon]
MKVNLEKLALRNIAHLTTIGRKTGKAREVEVYFVYQSGKFFFLSHGDSQWHRNLKANPSARLQIGEVILHIKATGIEKAPRLVGRVMDMFKEKYGRREVAFWYEGTERYAVEAEVIRIELA